MNGMLANSIENSSKTIIATDQMLLRSQVRDGPVQTGQDSLDASLMAIIENNVSICK